MVRAEFPRSATVAAAEASEHPGRASTASCTLQRGSLYLDTPKT